MLLSELYLKLRDWKAARLFENRRQFYKMIGEVLDNFLKDWCKAAGRQKRQGSQFKVPIDGIDASVSAIHVEYIDCHRALEELEIILPRQKEIFELRVLHGLAHDEIANLLNISPATVKREYKRAVRNLRKLLGEVDVET